MAKTTFPKTEDKFNQWLVEQYFIHGSVDEVFRQNKHSIPVSYANYQRILDKWGVVKAAGPNSKLTESLEFLSHLAYENVPFEKLYKKMPHSFKTSAVTLYRVLSYVKQGITRRVGTALVITPYNSDKNFLIGKDVSISRLEVGKPHGSLSLPMGYSNKLDSKKDSIRRVLQQEVFTKQTINNQFPEIIIPNNPKPYMYLDIADVRVALYHLTLSKELSDSKHLSSFKLKNYRFENIKVTKSKDKRNYRAGVIEAINGYTKYLNLVARNLSVNPLQEKSILNKEITSLVVEVEH